MRIVESIGLSVCRKQSTRAMFAATLRAGVQNFRSTALIAPTKELNDDADPRTNR